MGIAWDKLLIACNRGLKGALKSLKKAKMGILYRVSKAQDAKTSKLNIDTEEHKYVQFCCKRIIIIKIKRVKSFQ